MYRRILLIMLCVGLTSCGGLGMMVSPQQNAADQDSLTLSRPPANFVDGAVAVGAALGYQAKAVDRNSNEVLLQKRSDLGIGVLIGKVALAEVHITLEHDNRTVDISVQMTGNFETTDQAAAAKIIADFKEALVKKFAT